MVAGVEKSLSVLFGPGKSFDGDRVLTATLITSEASYAFLIIHFVDIYPHGIFHRTNLQALSTLVALLFEDLRVRAQVSGVEQELV